MSVAVTTSSGGTDSSSGGTSSDRDVLAKKLDILFVVDNSRNMVDKHKYLAMAATELVDRLANPRCVDGEDPALAEGCPEGQHREFAPVPDMHIGVISTSLGSQGGDICTPASPSFVLSQNDGGKLMPSVRPDLTSYQGQGFLAWSGDGSDEMAEHDLPSLKSALVDHIQSVGEVGCGYEAPLEAMYRFLIDPSPAKEVVVGSDGMAHPTLDGSGNVLLDTEVLDQRSEFLRPDAALVVVLLSDEDDCSIQGSGIGWLTGATEINGNVLTMPAATSTCADDPNDPCCRSCGLAEESVPEGCVPVAEDPSCAASPQPLADTLNLRCFDQKRRFGMDLLYPVDRYVAGLTNTELDDPWSCNDEECPPVRNPLFPPDEPENTFTRRASEVFVVSLVGVPWQDLATPESLTEAGLTYRSSFDADDWSLVLGNPKNYVAADDPLMVAQPDPRSGTHPVTGEALANEASTDPTENSINGHEFVNLNNTWLQHACIFPLTEPKDCSDTAVESCDCTEAEAASNKALCQPPEGGSATTTQYFAGASPSLRQLELMSKLPHGLPASICPKVIDGDVDDSSYGYNPAMRALIRELGSVLR